MELQHEYLREVRRKARARKDYFDDEEEDDLYAEVRQSGRSGADEAKPTASVDEEVDPLDAFMQGIDAQVVKENAVTRNVTDKPEVLNGRDDDIVDDYAPSNSKRRRMGDGDSDEEVYATAKQIDDEDDPYETGKKEIEVLAPIDHSKIEYEPFRKNFYTPHPSIVSMTAAEVDTLRKELGVRTEGTDVPFPIRSFVHVGFDRKMLAMLMKLGLEAPTPIQAQAFPLALSGRDIIGIAKTGSGKTLAFILPMVRHVMDQRELTKDEGPIAVVLSPTRELAHQIFVQAKKFATIYGAGCAAVYGGVGKWEQIQALRKGAEIVVATPGRLIEMIRKKTIRMTRVTFVVLDEADRMFEMGFEPQLRSIMGQIRPDRQTLMFSATFRRRVEVLAMDVLDNPVKIMIGQIGQANEDIHQLAVVLPGDKDKWPWLMANLKRLANEGRLLIFASSKIGCEELTKNLNAMNFQALSLHGDKNQQERSQALAKLKSGECQILVATDVAARGLDVKNIKNVVNYDVAKNIDTHVHRIGRTGRMGLEGFEPGTAYTLVTMKESQFAAQLVYNMDVSGQHVSSDLLTLAKRDPRFRRGMPAKRSTTYTIDGASHHQSMEGYQVSTGPSHEPTLDETDEAELERWSESRRKSRADQRKGIGFASSSHTGRGKFGGFGQFVKSSSSSSLANAFRSSFVKSSTSDAMPSPSVVPAQAASEEAIPDTQTLDPSRSKICKSPISVPKSSPETCAASHAPVLNSERPSASRHSPSSSRSRSRSYSPRRRSHRSRSRSRSNSYSPRHRSHRSRSRSRRRTRSKSRGRYSRKQYRSASRSRSRSYDRRSRSSRHN